MASRPGLEQAVINNIKMARVLIRTRHSIEADDELNEVIPRIRAELEVQAQRGLVGGLSFDRLRELLYGDAA